MALLTDMLYVIVQLHYNHNHNHNSVVKNVINNFMLLQLLCYSSPELLSYLIAIQFNVSSFIIIC